jgi:prevent-host-death family protein
MRVVGVHEAKTHLSRLLRRVAAGEEIVIARGGRPVARLVPITDPRESDFDAPLPDDVLGEFES